MRHVGLLGVIKHYHQWKTKTDEQIVYGSHANNENRLFAATEYIMDFFENLTPHLQERKYLGSEFGSSKSSDKQKANDCYRQLKLLNYAKLPNYLLLE